DEGRSVAAGVDQLAGDAVDVLARRADGGRPHPFRLRLLEDGVEVAEFTRRRSGEHGAGDVTAITVKSSAEVAHHRFTLLDAAGARLVVGTGRVRPAADDGEIHPAVALRPQPAADVGGDLRLRPPDERYLT